MFIYLALNCGYTQVEIANLRYNEIIQEDGRWYIQRRRSKTLKQNDFEAIHILWPETADLLNKLKTVNKYGVALLSENGTPLRSAKPKKDIISDTYLVLQKRTKVSLPFKQFRKIGATAIQKLGSDEIRRLYKAGTIMDSDKVYVREAWEKLHPVLDRWGDELRADGVLK